MRRERIFAICFNVAVRNNDRVRVLITRRCTSADTEASSTREIATERDWPTARIVLRADRWELSARDAVVDRMIWRSTQRRQFQFERRNAGIPPVGAMCVTKKTEVARRVRWNARRSCERVRRQLWRRTALSRVN